MFYLKVVLTGLLLLGVNIFVQAQNSLRGTITSQETNEPVVGATIFIENTTVGTISDEEGKFLLNNIPSGFNRIVVSHIGFKTHTGRLGGNPSLNIKLKVNVTALKEVDIQASRDKQWERLLKQFEKSFFGNTLNGRQCKILNPWVIELSRDREGTITGFSTDLIQIENSALGYQIDFWLEKIEIKNNQTTYSGKPLFTPLDPQDESEKLRWQKNRKRTYFGSRQHFIFAMINDQLDALGFEIYKVELDKESQGFKTLDRIRRDELYSNNALVFDDFISVVYTHEEPETGFKNDRNSSTRMAYSGPDQKMVRGGIEISNKVSEKQQVSFLFNRSSKIVLNKEGLIRNPEYLLEYGYWSWERIGDLLPNEYHLDFVEEDKKAPIEVSKPLQNSQVNGFELVNLLVEEDEIKSGGVAKDGIAALSNARFIEASKEVWLTKKDRVLGVEFNGVAKAYPIKILERHEAVNDLVGDKPVLITYCPLCGSGMAFDPVVNGQKKRFGISGLLYNSDVLLYDQESESLWSQIESKSISGEMSGTKIEHLPTYHMSWEDWKSKFPNSLVMTRETGHNIDYDQSAYKGYEKTPRLMFPVKDLNPYLATKELVIGIELNGKYKAYTLKKLKKNKKPMEDIVGGQKILITYYPKSNSAVITDENDQILPSTRLYWFAWYAFHPDTELH